MWLRALAVAAGLGGCGLAAAAQDDPMEAQRCVWQCLAASPGAASAEYNACVAARCNDSPAPQAAPPPAPGPAAVPQARPWTGGATADGRGHWAGVRSVEGGTDLLLICGPGGVRFLQVVGPEGGVAPADLIFVVDGAAHVVTFQQMEAVSATAVLSADAPVIAALAGGRSLILLNPAGYQLGRFGLAGAQAQISAALAACR